MATLPAPDFPTGGEIVMDTEAMREIYRTGRGSSRCAPRWRYDAKANIIEVYEIPYTATVEAIMDKVAELVKAGKCREIAVCATRRTSAASSSQSTSSAARTPRSSWRSSSSSRRSWTPSPATSTS